MQHKIRTFVRMSPTIGKMVAPEAVLAVIRASRPQLRTAHDRVAFALHAAFLASGYTVLASGARAAFDPPRDVPQDEDVGTEGWNDLQDAYAFRYLSPQKKIIDVKCTVLGDLLMVDAAPSDNSASSPAHLELNVKNFAKEGDCRSYSQHFLDFDGMLKQFSMLTSNWEPKPSAPTHAQRREDFSEHEETGGYEPGYQMPRVPALGASDLMPGVGAGVFPHRRDGGFESGEVGASQLGPHDPAWGTLLGSDRTTGIPDDGFSSIPPGARFDPFGPPGVAGFEPSRFGRGRRPSGQPHPELERFGHF